MGGRRGHIFLGVVAESGSEECVGPQARVAVEQIAHEKGVAALRRADLESEGEARMAMDDRRGWHARLWQSHGVIFEAAQFDPEALVVGDDEA
jgi:hypothetical protein